LAVSRSLQGRGLGGELLVEGLGVALKAMRLAGGRLIVVDAIDDAARGFYEHHGFKPIRENPNRLVMKASIAAAHLSLEWP
jgi:ribosomal protein S18 acetylase RimI-like enzyme